jgi:3-ketosteroid 9alpha-monooxygenase subunit B
VEERGIVLFSGGSGITPVISIIKSALAETRRSVELVYSNRDARSIIFRDELDALVQRYGGRFAITYLLDEREGFLDREKVRRLVADDLDRDFYICGPGPFMDVVEQTLHELGVSGRDQIHIERFVSPHDPSKAPVPVEVAMDAVPDGAPQSITIVLDGVEHQVPYAKDETVLAAARRAGLDTPFSCEEGYCSCCMAKLTAGDVKMAVNDCLTADLLAEGWVLTCQSRCQSHEIRVEYPD